MKRLRLTPERLIILAWFAVVVAIQMNATMNFLYLLSVAR
jgi:hypothetical protein